MFYLKNRYLTPQRCLWLQLCIVWRANTHQICACGGSEGSWGVGGGGGLAADPAERHVSNDKANYSSVSARGGSQEASRSPRAERP